MKQTWKKLGSLVSVGILAVSLTACGSTKNEINEKVAQNLNDGQYLATAWGCDLTYDYVRINGDYRS